MNEVTLSHGAGGALTQELITELFASVFKNRYLDELDDAAVVSLGKGQYALSTDSYVVDPIFFPGGDIGKLAVCGTINDLASCAAQPLYITAGFLLEEGLSFSTLERIVQSMAKEAAAGGVKIVTGDTKVVPRGKLDKIFINTTGVGVVKKRLHLQHLRPGDQILINGPVAQHGLSILLAREKFTYQGRIKSDCNSLWSVVKSLLLADIDIRFMRDPTRGGVTAAANEAAQLSGYSLFLDERKIPLETSCRSLSEVLGLEPLDIANEGKMLFFVASQDANKALGVLKKHPLGARASIIGEVLKDKGTRVYLKTSVGGEKILSYPMTEPVPRIC